MELKATADREGRLSSFLRGELKMSTGLINRLKWGDAIRVNGVPRHTDFAVQSGDVISQFDVNSQLVVGGLGTANSDLIELLGLNIHKAVILSFAREDQVGPIMDCLEEKFATIKKGKGISIAVPLSSVIGVNVYQYLSNNRMGREG